MEKTVFEQWENEIVDKYKEAFPIEENADALLESLKHFLSRMFLKHGVECAALLNPESAKTERWLNEIRNDISSELPSINETVDTILKLEIPGFFIHADENRRKYITNVFNSSFFWHLAQVDDKFSKVLKKVTRGQKLYLDNNILYDIVGLNGIIPLKAIHRLLNFANELGYNLFVTSTTVTEFKESLRRQTFTPVPKELARIALKYLEHGSFLQVYWDEFVKKGTTIEEFISEKSHLKEVLIGLGITETNEYNKQIVGSQQLRREISVLQGFVRGAISHHVVYHDAYHRVLISKIRKRKRYDFHEAKAWFLTNDSKLTPYDRVARKGEKYLPFCLTSQHWIQINRPLLARSSNQEDYDKSFHVLVTEPFVRSMVSSVALDDFYGETVGKLSRYKNMEPDIASRILTDTHFMLSLKTEDDEQKREEKLENKFINIAKDLFGEKDDLSAKIEKYEDQAGKSLTEISDKADELFHDKEERKKLETELSFLRSKLDKQATIFRWILSTFLLLATFVLIWFGENWIFWPWFFAHGNKLILQISVQVFALFLILLIPLQKYRRWLATGLLLNFLEILQFAQSN